MIVFLLIGCKRNPDAFPSLPPPAKTVAMHQVPMTGVDGMPYDDPQAIQFGAKGLTIMLNRAHFDSRVLLGLDGNDVYLVYFLNDSDGVIDRATVGRGRRLGIIGRILTIPDKARLIGFTKIRIVPLAGDDKFSIAFLQFSPAVSSDRNKKLVR